jgi:hypothetical protein
MNQQQTPFRTHRMKTLFSFLYATILCAQAGEIHDAAAKGDTARLIAILKKDSLLLHARDYQGRATPLAVAIAQGRLGCVRALFDAGANVNESGDENLVMPLMPAVGSMDEEVRVLFQFAEARRRLDSLPDGVARRKSHDKLAELEKQLPPESHAKIPQLPLPTPPERLEILKIMLAQKPDLKIQDKAPSSLGPGQSAPKRSSNSCKIRHQSSRN